MNVNDILRFLSDKAPLELQMDYDNAGLLVGDPYASVEKILVALDITSDVIDEAHQFGAQLIVSHHPVIWEPMKSILYDKVQDYKVIQLIKSDIAAICMHTNLDIAKNGVNDVLLHTLGAEYIGILEYTGDNEGCGRIGRLPVAQTLSGFLELCKSRLHTNGIRFHDAGREVLNIAVMGGSGGNEIELAFSAGCDTYITSDIKYDQFLLAKELGINLIDADHFCTENPITNQIYQWLIEKYPEINVKVSSKHCATAQFYV